jgi:hypothetical protein
MERENKPTYFNFPLHLSANMRAVNFFARHFKACLFLIIKSVGECVSFPADVILSSARDLVGGTVRRVRVGCLEISITCGSVDPGQVVQGPRHFITGSGVAKNRITSVRILANKDSGKKS